MPRNTTYINAKEAGELGLPLRYGDIVDNKVFRNYCKHKVTGKIYEQFVDLESLTLRDRRKRASIRKFCSRVKLFKGCAECGYKKHPAALHFNHIDPTKKTGNVSKMKTWKKVKEEMRKCEVLCANCHAIKTVNEKHHLNKDNG